MEDFDPDTDFELKQQFTALEIDPAKYQHYIDLRRTSQHLPMAVLAGSSGAILGALAWLGITVFTTLQVGWMAIAIGIIIGGLVRVAGDGIDRGFGLTAAILTLAGSAAGTLLAGCWTLALLSEEAAFADVLLALTPGLITQIYIAVFTPMNLACYGAGGAAAYWLGIRRIRRAEMAMCAVDVKRTQDKSNVRAI